MADLQRHRHSIETDRGRSEMDAIMLAIQEMLQQLDLGPLS